MDTGRVEGVREKGGRMRSRELFSTAVVVCALVGLSGCKSASPPPDRLSQVIAKGSDLFFNETFGGNGRTCGTCHPAENNFTIDPAFIATLPKDNPLFVAEFIPALKENFENPALMREFGLILENLDGFADLKNKFVMRGVPHVLGLRTSVNSPGGPRTGWSGDGAPGDGSLRSFATGAVIQHFTKTLNRIPGVDFRLPTDEELDALEAFQLSLGPARSTFRRSWRRRPPGRSSTTTPSRPSKARSGSTTARRSTNPRRAARWPSSTPRVRVSSSTGRRSWRSPPSCESSTCSRTSGKASCCWRRASRCRPQRREHAFSLAPFTRRTTALACSGAAAFTPKPSLTSRKHDVWRTRPSGATSSVGSTRRRPSESRRKRERSSSSEGREGGRYDRPEVRRRAGRDGHAPVGQRIGAVRAKDDRAVHSDWAVAGAVGEVHRHR